jgi:hypothetical protein
MVRVELKATEVMTRHRRALPPNESIVAVYTYSPPGMGPTPPRRPLYSPTCDA